ncbi:MAG TPA: DUF3987 domain-containing protein, partial [Vineibacter sp.]|nr:DUF3987 domain-containing protein [Vineibacter sp.]
MQGTSRENARLKHFSCFLNENNIHKHTGVPVAGAGSQSWAHGRFAGRAFKRQGRRRVHQTGVFAGCCRQATPASTIIRWRMSARDFASLTHTDYGNPIRWWHYTDTFAVADLLGKDGIISKRAVRNGDHCYWHDPMPPWPLYRAAALLERPDAPVLVLHSEKAAEAAVRLFADHVCVTWPGGSHAVNQVDVLPLLGRDVVLWPQNDGRGVTAMARLQVRLSGVARAVVMLELPLTWPRGWDVAWPLPSGVTDDALRTLLRDAGAAFCRPGRSESPRGVDDGDGAAVHATAPTSRAQREASAVEEVTDAALTSRHDNSVPAPRGSASLLPPEGEGAPKGRKGDVRTEAMTLNDAESVATSLIRCFAPSSPSGGRTKSPALSDDDEPDAQLSDAGTYIRPVAIDRVCHSESSEDGLLSNTSSQRADGSRSPVAATAPSVPDWPSPDFTLLDDDGCGDRPPWPGDVLPPFWRAWSETAARHASAPLESVALALLTSAAGLIGGARRVAPAPSWSEPCVLWTALVGAAAGGKTAAMETSLRLVRALDRDL